MSQLDQFREIWCCDFEFKADAGERPVVHCMVGRELRTGKVLKLWRDEIGNSPPFNIGENSLFVAYFASAELGCFLSLGWPMPLRVLDLYTEFRCLTNGHKLPSGRGLLGALIAHGLDGISAATKDDMRDVAIRGGPFTSDEKRSLFAYCESDVMALENLLVAMSPKLDLGRALLRGRYMAAVAHMEHTGTPIDVETLQSLRANWAPIKGELIARVDANFGVYDGQTFKRGKFFDWLELNDIPWPRLASGPLAIDSDTFRDMAKMYPQVAPLKELRHTLGPDQAKAKP